jgi:uncharacterized repeat protein (TIGR02543 family)
MWPNFKERRCKENDKEVDTKMRKWIFLLVALLLLLTPLMGACGEKKYDLTISVSPSGGGTTVPAAGTHEYKKDTVVTITATAATGYQFDKWSGDASGTTATTTVTMTKDKTVRAEFKKIQYTLTMAVDPAGGGTTDPAAGTHDYDTGTVVDITATPATGYEFVNWTGDVADADDPTTTVTMSANKTVTANFALSTYTLTMAKVGNGTIVPDVGAHTENAGAAVDLTATPDTGWQFVNWTGDVATVADVNDATTTVTMNGNYTITANFIQVFTLTIAKVGNGTTNPAVGDHIYAVGTVVNITATPDTGWKFDNWSGDASGTSATVSVTMSANKAVTANFSALASYTLTIAVAGTGTTNPAAGPHTYYEGTVVNITAIPATGWQFDNWSGDASGTNATISVTMTANKTVTANFSAVPTYDLTMAVDDAAHGSTTPAVGTHTYNEGTVVTITATPATGWQFDSWTGDVADPDSATTTVTVDADKTVTANFVEVVAPSYPGVGSQWVYEVTYGTEVTTWTVDVTAEETVDGVACYKTATSFSEPPQRVASGISVIVTAAQTWRSEDSLAQYKAIAAINMYGMDVQTTMTDTYTAGTPDFFTLSNAWTVSEYTVLNPPLAAPSTTVYDITVVGMESVTVPAGTFNCYKIEYSVAGSVKKTEWWSPTVLAFVKQVSTGTYALPETQELASYSLA